jgi:hypothetical protein
MESDCPDNPLHLPIQQFPVPVRVKTELDMGSGADAFPPWMEPVAKPAGYLPFNVVQPTSLFRPSSQGKVICSFNVVVVQLVCTVECYNTGPAGQA